MLIDWHVHINDPKFIGKPWWPVPVPMTMEDALRAHVLAGLDRTVISNAVHYIRHMEFDERRRRRHRELEPASRQVPGPAPGQVRRHGDLRAQRRR